MNNKIYTIKIDSIGKADTFSWENSGNIKQSITIKIPWWVITFPYLKYLWHGQKLIYEEERNG